MTKTKFIILLPELTPLADFVLSMLSLPFCLSQILKFCFLYESELDSSSWWWPLPLMNLQHLLFFTFIFCYYCVPITVSPWLDSKPFETLDWQFYSVACRVLNEGVPGLSVSILFSRCQSFWFLFSVLFMSSLYWSVPSIALLLATVVLVFMNIMDDFWGFLD